MILVAMVSLVLIQNANGLAGFVPGRLTRILKHHNRIHSGGTLLYAVPHLRVSGDGRRDYKYNPLSRRRLLNGMASLSILGTVGTTQEATAVDFQVPGITKFAGSPNKQRIGGLANKIRKICNIMVRQKEFIG